MKAPSCQPSTWHCTKKTLPITRSHRIEGHLGSVWKSPYKELEIRGCLFSQHVPNHFGHPFFTNFVGISDYVYLQLKISGHRGVISIRASRKLSHLGERECLSHRRILVCHVAMGKQASTPPVNRLASLFVTTLG